LSSHNAEAENLLKPSEVAALFRVDPKTVTRWAKAGKIGSIRTLGGHRRFRESEVKALLASADDASSPDRSARPVGLRPHHDHISAAL
jgi:excisionase family DNA binding protein